MPPAKPYTLHQRISYFVDWIAPDATREDDTRGRADNIRKAIKAKATDDQLTVRSTPSSGSFATRTGLRRHMRGTSEVEGFDVDLPFVVSPVTKDDEKLKTLLDRFDKYAKAAYPDTERERTKSSIKLLFADKMNFDLVPLLATTDSERQILVRDDGERRETSVQGHIEFVKSRTKKSSAIVGAVQFNEMIRLLKWWRCVKQCDTASDTLSDVASFLINLLAAQAFDARSVKSTYDLALADWFGYLCNIVSKRTVVAFTDYLPLPSVASTAFWSVYDPLNRENNIVGHWGKLDVHEFKDWLEEARDHLYDAITAFNERRESAGLEIMAKVLGNAFLHHSEPA